MNEPRHAPCRVIGYVRSGSDEPAGTPIQSLRNDREDAVIAVLPEFAGGLDGLAGFDYAWVISWLDRQPGPPADCRVVPFLLGHTGERLGVFATRHPGRPNPIGLSVVRVVAVDGATVRFRGVDLCDGTPVLDIKPWQQHLDIPGYRDGWPAVEAIRGGWYQRCGVAERNQLLPEAVDADPERDHATRPGTTSIRPEHGE